MYKTKKVRRRLHQQEYFLFDKFRFNGVCVRHKPLVGSFPGCESKSKALVEAEKNLYGTLLYIHTVIVFLEAKAASAAVAAAAAAAGYGQVVVSRTLVMLLQLLPLPPPDLFVAKNLHY